MKRYVFAIIFCTIPCMALPAKSAMIPYRLDCDLGKGFTQIEHAGNLTVKLMPNSGTCHLGISDDAGVVFEYEATEMQVSTALDLGDAEERFVLVQADNPVRAFLFSIDSHPSLVASLHNDYGFWIEPACSGKGYDLWTADGAFSGDPELADIYHYDLVVPTIALHMNKGKLRNVTATCATSLNKTIEAERESLKADQIRRFRRRAVADPFRANQIKGKIIYIALAYLYTGRDSLARKTIDQMWPPNDREQIWTWMKSRRSEGFLKQIPS